MGNKSFFETLVMEERGCVTFGDGSKKRVVGKGTISIPKLPSLSNALFIDSLKANLISISHLSDEGFSVLCSKNDCSILKPDGQTLLKVFLRPGTRQTSYELWRGRKPNVSYFHSFGSKCYILNDRDQLGKFDAKSDEGIFIGYALNSRAYRVFNLKTRTVMESSNVIVDDPRLKTNDHEDEVTVDDDSPLEKVVETPYVGMSNLDEEDTQSLNRVPLLNSNEPTP
ncbi:hypothetical protein Q3G72_024310 [Acer saccharum]|nr:hypothetical protein Q3G72_024310 [Acer saccharum]